MVFNVFGFDISLHDGEYGFWFFEVSTIEHLTRSLFSVWYSEVTGLYISIFWLNLLKNEE